MRVAHGSSKFPEYQLWAQMKARCFNPLHKAYPDYGGRGITVHPEWVTDFGAFIAHVGRRPSPEYSLDRIDNDKGYVPGNLRWALKKVQNNNRRPKVPYGSKPEHVPSGRKTNFKHGGVGTPEYAAWRSLKNRCLNPEAQDYESYGGRGIGVYPGWVEDFAVFFRDVGPRPSPQHSIDRIRNDLGYFPGNVRWATKSEQSANRRPMPMGPDHGNHEHGLTKTPEYKTWGSIKTRLYNPKSEKYATYGGLGITMCQRWKDSGEAFIEDMGVKPTPEHTVGRLDHEGHYSCGKCEECQAKGWPMNCAWQTKTEQNRNRKTSSRSGKLTQEKASEIRRRALAGEHLGHLAKEFGIAYSLVGKIKRGTSWKDA